MAIKKRKTIPDPTKTTSTQTDSFHDEELRTKGRAAALQGLRLDVYMFIGNNPQCTRSDVAKGLRLGMSSATARIKELIDEGFVHEPLGVRKRNSSGVNARVLQVTEQAAGSKPLDKVRIEVELAIDCNGNYYVSEARVVNSAYVTALVGNQPVGYRKVKTQRFTVTAPRVKAPARPMYSLDQDEAPVVRMTRADLSDVQGEIIDIEPL